MRVLRATIAFVLALVIAINFVPQARACGPSSIEPIFVFKESPDPPFADYTQGKIGIVQPSHGRKTLFIAYRYLNDGGFTAGEQQALVDALNGKAPEDEGNEAVKEWIAARKEIGLNEEKAPEIYTERRFGGYEFFPNCSRNAFEVATETLKQRAATYGAEDQRVRSWLEAQDTVFQNCVGGAHTPVELGPESPAWLRKDRDYQIAAAYFYSLNFDEACKRFEKIALDNESAWQQTADYLVARTLVRQASLTTKEATKREVYEQAECRLELLSLRSAKFRDASKKLLALVRYRVHPEQRVRELAQTLTTRNANENLRQDLIDYVWLLDKIEEQVGREEKKRKEALKPAEQKEGSTPSFESTASSEMYQAIQRGELIRLTIYPKFADGRPDYRNAPTVTFKYDVTESDVLRAFEEKLGRKLTTEEVNDGKAMYAMAESERNSLVSPNHKWSMSDSSQHEGCYFDCKALALDLLPDCLRADELSDWIFTFQSQDENSYRHAAEKWRETDSVVWLMAALTKAEKASPGLDRLLGRAEAVQRDSPAFPTIAYHLVRLKIAFGKTAEARKMLDQIISSQFELLPVSAQNQFIEQRFQLAANLSEFLKFGARKPVAFYDEGQIGKLSELFDRSKQSWDAELSDETKEEYEQRIDDQYKDLLPWDNRRTFDQQTVDLFNWHFPLDALVTASHDPALPRYLQRRLVLAAWTRAILLKNETVAQRIAPDVLKLAPEMSSVFNRYLDAGTPSEKENAALYVLLKFPDLSPLVAGGLPTFGTAEQSDYYFETSWWCPLSTTEYSFEGKEVPKIVSRPGFLTDEQLQAAQHERTALIAIGDGKSYLGKQVLRWAGALPDDPLVPEALFIAVKANESYKYGCGGWNSDEETRQKAEALLRERYSRSSWTAKLGAPEDN